MINFIKVKNITFIITSYLKMSDSDSIWSTSSSDSDDIAIFRQPKVYKQRISDFDIWPDYEFFYRYRLSKVVANELLNHIRNRITSPTNRGGAIKPETKLLLTLRFYATGNMLISVADFVGVSVASASRVVKQVSYVIASLKPDFVYMPVTRRELEDVVLDFYNIAGFPTCCGTIDCTHIKIINPGGDDGEIYRNRKGYFSINVQTVSDAQLKIRNIVARWPGSCHDQTIFINSSLKRNFENGLYSNYRLIGDSGYALRNYLFTPLQTTRTESQRLYNESLIRTRNTVERQYGVWKRRFPILSLGMRVNVNTAMAIIVATAVLHNIAIEMNEVEPELFEDHVGEEEDGAQINHDHDIRGAQAIRDIFINENFNAL